MIFPGVVRQIIIYLFILSIFGMCPFGHHPTPLSSPVPGGCYLPLPAWESCYLPCGAPGQAGSNFPRQVAAFPGR